MSNSPDPSLKTESKEATAQDEAAEYLTRTGQGEIQGDKTEISTEISRLLSQCHLDTPVIGQREDGPTPAIFVHGGSRLEASNTNSQITAGRDMSSYHVAGNLVQVTVVNRSEESVTTTETRSETPRASGKYVGDEDVIAINMPIPLLAPCILERESQHTEIVDKLVSVQNARVAILGMGGIGKTTLACSIAEDSQIVDVYPRRLFLSFEGCSTPDLAYAKLATAFHIAADRRSSHQQILSQVLNCLKQEKTLLVIDNFETFWEASSNRRTAEELLGRFASLKTLAMIVTLRGIQRPGIIRWLKIEPLQPLTSDASKELLYFITDENYSESDLEYIRKLLDAVAGIPLAVTLIGSLLRDESESPQSLWNQWTRESTRAIRVANEVDSDDRLYKLDISLRLSIFGPRMSDNTREVLAAIAILPIGLNMDEEWLDRLQNILSGTIRVRDCIRTLRDVALGTLDSSASPPRLRLLPPVRDFCLNKENDMSLDTDFTHRLIDIYTTDLVKHQNWGSSEDYDWVTTELNNLNAMLNHAITLRYATDNLGSVISRYTEWRRFLCIPETDTLERAIDSLPDHPQVIAKCLQALGTILSNTNREEEAIPRLEQAMSIYGDIGDKYERGWCLYFLGFTHYCLDNYDDAEYHLSEARDLFTETGNMGEKGTVLQFLSDTYLGQERLSQAESTAKEALKLCRAANRRRGEINALRTLGELYRAQGKYDLAIETLTNALNISKLTHDTLAEANGNDSLGYVYRDKNEPDQAASHLRLAISLYERAGRPGRAEQLRATLEELERSLNSPS